MATTTAAGLHRARPTTLAPGLKFAIQYTAVAVLLFMAFGLYGYSGRNVVLDTFNLIVLAWDVATTPWTYAVAGAALLAWKTNIITNLVTGPRGAHRG